MKPLLAGPLILLVVTALLGAAAYGGRTAARSRTFRPARPLPLLPMVLLLTALAAAAACAAVEPLPGKRPLDAPDDLAEPMVAGIERFLTRETGLSVERRERFWKRDLSSAEAYRRSVEPNREHLRRILGAVDPRVPLTAELFDPAQHPGGLVARGKRGSFTARTLRLPVFPGVEVEALALRPARGQVRACVITVPDCDWTPEMLCGLAPGAPPEAQFARRLAESGCEVLVPVLIDRRDTYSGNPSLRMTNQPHREFIYRAAFEMGRHVIGFEVQKLLTLVDYLEKRNVEKPLPLGIAGYGEGGLLAFYAGALDGRIDAALASGYFQSRQALWREPIYRNVWALLDEFGDAEIAGLIAPRPLIVEHCRFPVVNGPPTAREGRAGAAPGSISTPPVAEVRAEVERARHLIAGLQPAPEVELLGDGTGQPGSEPALTALLLALGLRRGLSASAAAPHDLRQAFDPDARQKRQVEQLIELNQRLLREGEGRRRGFWSKADGSSVNSWRDSSRAYRDYFWDDVIGRFPPPDLTPPTPNAQRPTPGNPRTRLILDEPKYRGYEVVLDIWPDVVASGILLVPKELKPGERRAVVVCQHGLEGRPRDVSDPRIDSPYYHRFGCRLAEEGYVTFAPQNPYIFGDRFRLLQRKLNPLRKSLFAIIVRQHERILEWLGSLPFVDRERIAFYGLSYGGKTAMRVPAMLEGYCLSICSGDYNEWIWKNVNHTWQGSYMFTPEWEMVEFDLGNTFNYAEMSWLICPRPFMVERGHNDGVGLSEYVSYEYSKTRERYDRLGIGDRTEIEYFVGPHEIHGVGTFAFLHRWLGKP